MDGRYRVFGSTKFVKMWVIVPMRSKGLSEVKKTHKFLRTADLQNSNLIIDCIFEGGRSGNAGDDPLNALLGVSNQGGFRFLGKRECPRLIVLITSLSDPDWPDSLDHQSGRFIYYGDNKKPGHDLHETSRFGNRLLRHIFENSHAGFEKRQKVPPILVFSSTKPTV